jgi:DNA polymerase
MSELEELKIICEHCQRCDLARTRTKVVFGRGNEHPLVVVCGEAPGAKEDSTGEPFVGAAGKKLDELFTKAGLTPDDYYILNTIKCRPPENRDPSDAEKAACLNYLDEQIALLDPEIIVTLGNHATKYMLEDENYPGITALRGKPTVGRGGRRFFPTFHPAAAIYDRSKMSTLEEDFAELGRIVRELEKTA